jgi:SulP family sulfate permease
MAYSVLAGLPAQYGLYCATFPLLIYAIFGTSRHISLGPMAITSLVLGTTCRKFNVEDGSKEYIQLAMNISLFAGIFTLILGFLKLGVLTNYLSNSVLKGFLTASALLISLSQIKYITGINIPRFKYTHETLGYLLTHLHESKKWSLIFGLTSWAILLLFNQWKIKFKGIKVPWSLSLKPILFNIMQIIAKLSSIFVIVFSSLCAYYLDKSSPGELPTVGFIPPGFVSPHFTFIDNNKIVDILFPSFLLSIISYVINWAITKKYAYQFKYPIDATQELIAIGYTITIGVLLNAFIVAGGVARSSVNVESGGKSQLSSIFAAVFMILALLFFTKLFYFIPMAVLGAIIEVAVYNMIDFNTMRLAYSIDKKDCCTMIITFLATFFIGIESGILIGVILSIFFIVNAGVFPYIEHLGLLKDSPHYVDMKSYKNASQIPGVAIIRMDAILFFANCDYFKETVLKSALGIFHTNSEEKIRLVILDAGAWVDIDLNGTLVLKDLIDELEKNDIHLVITNVKRQLKERLRNAKLFGLKPLVSEEIIPVIIEDSMEEGRFIEKEEEEEEEEEEEKDIHINDDIDRIDEEKQIDNELTEINELHLDVDREEISLVFMYVKIIILLILIYYY